MIGFRPRLGKSVLAVFCLSILPETGEVQAGKMGDVPTLDALGKQYLDEGLPMPPADAPLMRVFSGSWSQRADGKMIPEYLLGYRVKPGGTDGKPGTFLVGTETYEPERTETYKPESSDGKPETPQVVNPGRPLSGNLTKEWTFGPAFPVNQWLALACQGHLRGDDKLAFHILDAGLARERSFGGPLAVSSGRGWVDPRVNRSMAEPRPDGGVGERLAATAWNHWMNRAIQPGTDRREILARLEKLQEAWPSLDGAYQRAYVQSLRLTLQPGQGKSGSVEAIIDALVESTSKVGRMYTRDPPEDPNYAALQTLGFDAVPDLIAHLDDPRLTRGVTQGFNNFRTLPRRVGEVASDLIEALAGPELAQDWLSRQLGNPAETKPVQQWWEKARSDGEEAYAAGHVLPAAKGENDRVNTACLSIVEARYPQQLGLIYTRLLGERPDLQSYDVVQAIGSSDKLPQEEKVCLLRQGMKSPNLGRMEEAANVLFKFDPSGVEAWIVAELDRLPADVKSPYWTCPEASMTRLVVLTKVPAVWQAFTRAACRASVGLRLELMNVLDYSHLKDEQRAERLAFLAGFFDDETVRVLKKSDQGEPYEGPCAAFTFPTISVRNFACLQAGGIMDLPDAPVKEWNAARWTAYGAEVRAALARQ